MGDYSIHFSAEAKNDLISFANYIKYSLNEPSIAKKKIEKIKQAIYKLKENPLIYVLINEDIFEKYNLRKIVVDKHIVFYTVENNTIYIVRILYGRRNWIDIL